MVMAMMLPTSLPLISLFRAVARQRPDRASLVALLIAGYLIIWTLFGILVYFGGWILRLLVEQSAWLETNGWVDAFRTGDEFQEFLVEQDERVSGTLDELGLL